MIAKQTLRRAALIGAIIFAVVILPAIYAWTSSGSDADKTAPPDAATSTQTAPEVADEEPAADKPALRKVDLIRTKVPLTHPRDRDFAVERPEE